MSQYQARQQEIVGKPPRIDPLSDGKLGPEARLIADRIRKAAGASMDVDIPEYVATMLRHPSLYEHHVALGTALLASGALPARQRELAVLRTAWLCGAPYEWGEHVEIAKRAGLTSAETEAITEGSQARSWNEQDRTVLRAAEELHDRAMISDATWSDLELFLDERQLIELPYVIGTYTKVAYLQNALRLRLARTNVGLFAR